MSGVGWKPVGKDFVSATLGITPAVFVGINWVPVSDGFSNLRYTVFK